MRGVCSRLVATLLSLLVIAGAAPHSVAGQIHTGEPPLTVPASPLPAIVNAFRTHQIVALGEGSRGSRQDSAFRLSLLDNPEFLATVDDLVVEFGNARHQALIDQFVGGEHVPPEALAQVWQDTAEPNFDFDVPVYAEFFQAVSALNRRRPAARQLRVLLAGPPIDWADVRSSEDVMAWRSKEDAYAVDLIRREVLLKYRRALVIAGNLRLQRKDERTNYDTADSLIGRLEGDGFTKAFTIWTSGRAETDFALLQSDASHWPAPSIAMLRGGRLGAMDVSSYFVSTGRLSVVDGKAVPLRRDQRRLLPMQEQFDAVLYLGPATATAYSPLTDAQCADARYVAMRTGRMALMPRGEAELARFRRACAPHK